jgi:hypothetical protein
LDYPSPEIFENFLAISSIAQLAESKAIVFLESAPFGKNCHIGHNNVVSLHRENASLPALELSHQ